MIEITSVFQPTIADQSCNIKSQIIDQLIFVRQLLVAAVGKLDVTELDTKLTPTTNSIGTLLAHIAAVEYRFQVLTFEEREFNMQEEIKWRGTLADELELDLIKGNGIKFYLDVLESVRSRTISGLNMIDNEWLLSAPVMDFQMPINNYYCWFHILEHEISHLGQIKMISGSLKRIGK